MKKVIFIITSKGGAGKSVYMYNVANLIKRSGNVAYYFDMDNESKSSMSQIDFVKVQSFNLIDTATKVIDRSQVGVFLDNFADNEKAELAVCDLGAASSEQILKYLESTDGRAIMDMYKDEIKFEFHCVVAGKNSYPPCATFCEELFNAAEPFADLYLVKNMREVYDRVQLDDIKKILDKYKAKEIEFSIVMGNGIAGIDAVKDRMYHGLPSFNIESRSTRKLYNLMLDEMNFPK